MGHQTYEVRVAGIVPDEDLRDMGAVTMATELATTTLYGEIADDAALYALLARLQALGLEVVEVRRLLRATHPGLELGVVEPALGVLVRQREHRLLAVLVRGPHHRRAHDSSASSASSR